MPYQVGNMKPLVLISAAVRLNAEFSAKGLTLATAESCTGGLVAAAVTAIAGSSAVFQGGLVAYSNHVKTSLLGVKDETLSIYGAVSEEVAREMAEGAIKLLKTSVAIATTGIAGPSGGTIKKPIGTVWIAMAGVNGTRARLLDLSGNRHEIQEQTVELALLEVLAYTESCPVRF